MKAPTIAERAQALSATLQQLGTPNLFGVLERHLSDTYAAGARSRDPLIARLREYAEHKAWCELSPDKPCTCGLDALLAEVAP